MPSNHRMLFISALFNWLRDRKYPVFLVLVATSMYAHTLNYPLLWDDAMMLQQNETLTDVANIKLAFSRNYLDSIVAKNSEVPYYRPVSLSILYFERALFGLESFGYKLFSLLLHLTSIWLLFSVMTRLFRPPGIVPASGDHTELSAFFGTAFFVVVPYSVDAVAFITNQGDLLVLVGTLTCISVFQKHLNTPRPWLSVVIFFITLLSSGSKETGTVIPAILFISAICTGHKPTRAFWYGISASLAAAILFIIARSLIIPPSSNFNPTQLVLEFPLYFFQALRWGFVPHPLALYESPLGPVGLNAITILSYLTTVAYFVAIVFAFLRNMKIVALGMAVWSIFILPSLVAIHFSPLFSPRYLYLPAIGICIMLGYTVLRIPRKSVPISIGLAYASLLLLTIIRLSAWRSGISLWSLEVERHPRGLGALNNYAAALDGQKRYGEATPRYMQLLEYAKKQKNDKFIALAYSKLAWYEENLHQNPDKAFSLYEESLRSFPTFHAWIGLGRIHARYDKNYQKALECFEKAEALRPNDFTVLMNIETIYATLGNFDKALEYNARLLKFVSDNPRATNGIVKRRETIMQRKKAVEAERSLK